MTPPSFPVFQWTKATTRRLIGNDGKAQRSVLPLVNNNLQESVEFTVLRLCLCGMFLYLSTTRNFLLIPRVDIRSQIISDNDSNYLSFMLPTTINRETKLSTEIKSAMLVNNASSLFPSDNMTISATILPGMTFPTVTRANVVNTIVDTAVAPVGSMIESYITNAIQRSVRRVAKPITIQTHPVVEQIIKKRITGHLKIGFVQVSRQKGANVALRNLVNNKDFSLLAVSSVVNMVPKSQYVASKTTKSLLTRRTSSIARRKATTKYLPVVVSGIGKPISKRYVQSRSVLHHSAGASIRTIKKGNIGKSIGRLSMPRRFRTPFNLAIKIGNGCLVAIPIIGGILSLNFSLQEFNRALEERAKNATAITTILFVIAGIADMIDAILHFVLSYVAYSQQPLERMDIIDRISLVCMIASVASLITAEIVSWKYPSNETSTTELL